MKNNIFLNHKLEEYNKKYRNHRPQLIKISKKQVEDFDKVHPLMEKNYLLKDRKWWLIGDTYYEVPKPPRFIWFRNLSAGVQAATCILACGAVTAAVVIPTVISFSNSEDRVVDVIGGDLKNAKPTKEGDTLVFDLTCKDEKQEVTEVTEVTIGNVVLDPSDYTFDKENHKLIIKKSGLDKAGEHDNITIKVTQGEKKVVYVTEIACDEEKTLKVGDEISFDDLHVKITPENATDKSYTVIEGGKSNADAIEIDTTNKKIIAKSEGEESVWVCPNGDNPEEKIMPAICVIKVEGEEPEYLKYLEFTYNSMDSNIYVTSKSGGTIPNELVIPDEVKGKYINNLPASLDPELLYSPDIIGDNDGTSAFAGSIITSLTVPNTIKKINNSAFKGCSSLNSIIINETNSSLKTISNNAFESCTALESITFPISIEQIGLNAFTNSGLTSAIFGESNCFYCFTTSDGKLNKENEYEPSSDPSINANNLKNIKTAGGFSDYVWNKSPKYTLLKDTEGGYIHYSYTINPFTPGISCFSFTAEETHTTNMVYNFTSSQGWSIEGSKDTVNFFVNDIDKSSCLKFDGFGTIDYKIQQGDIIKIININSEDPAKWPAAQFKISFYD